jgi:hypothetical protein
VKKTRGRKSRDTVPLTVLGLNKKLNIRKFEMKTMIFLIKKGANEKGVENV